MEDSTKPSPTTKPSIRYIAEIEALFASIGEGLIVTDETGRIIRVNKLALKLFGYKKSELMNQRYTDKISAVYESGRVMDVIDRPIAKSFLTGKVISERIRYRKKNGTIIPMQVTVSPLILMGKPVGAVQLYRDISAEIQMDRMKSDFISLASHQLRTPLSSVNIYAGMLLEGLGGELNPQQKSFAETILASAQRMNELIDTLLNITRIEARGIEINPSEIDIYEIVEEAISGIMLSVQEKHMNLEFFAEEDPFVTFTDHQLVKEVIVNLLTNAVKYTPSEGTISVSIVKQNNTIIINVKDTGYGIPTAAQRHVFTKFFRADNIKLKDVSGTGLGLYLTKMIAENLGGDLWFESTEGVGSNFHFSVPISDTPDQSA